MSTTIFLPEVYQGDTITWDFYWPDDVDLSAWTPTSQFRKNGAEVGEFTCTQPAVNHVRCVLSAASSQALPVGKMNWDLQLVSGSVTYTPMNAVVYVKGDTTQ
jgi:hypothetical protein